MPLFWTVKIKGQNKFLAAPGSDKSYTTNVLNARRFPSRAAAQAECCENETPFAVE